MNNIEKKIYINVESFLKIYRIPYKKHTDGFLAYTKYGKWKIIPNFLRRSKIVTIYSRFDCTEKIDGKFFKNFHYNSFSGKLNFHYKKEEIDKLFADFNYLCSIVA